MTTIGGTKLYGAAQYQFKPSAASRFGSNATGQASYDSVKFSGGTIETLRSLFHLYGKSIPAKVMLFPLSVCAIPLRLILTGVQKGFKTIFWTLPRKLLGSGQKS